MAKKENIANVTPEIIAEWKAKYGTVYCLEVAEEPERYDEPDSISKDLDEIPKIVGYLRKPDRKVMNFAMVAIAKNAISAGKAVVKDCWLGGDERLLSDENYSATAAFQAVELIEIYQSRLKKV